MGDDGTSRPTKGGPKPTDLADWLFGYGPRRRLLACLWGPKSQRVPIPKKGFTAARLAEIAGKSRPAIEADIDSLELLGLLARQPIGKRDRFFPRSTRLGTAIGNMIRAVDEVVGGQREQVAPTNQRERRDSNPRPPA